MNVLVSQQGWWHWLVTCHIPRIEDLQVSCQSARVDDCVITRFIVPSRRAKNDIVSDRVMLQPCESSQQPLVHLSLKPTWVLRAVRHLMTRFVE